MTREVNLTYLEKKHFLKKNQKTINNVNKNSIFLPQILF